MPRSRIHNFCRWLDPPEADVHVGHRGDRLCAASGPRLVGSIGGATGDRMSALAAGGLLAMLTNSLMPFAFDHGGRFAGIWPVVGFALAVVPR